MKRMTRALALLLPATFLAAALSGCGDGGTTVKPVDKKTELPADKKINPPKPPGSLGATDAPGSRTP